MRKGWIGNELPHPRAKQGQKDPSYPPGATSLHRKIKFINVNMLFAKVRSVFAVT